MAIDSQQGPVQDTTKDVVLQQDARRAEVEAQYKKLCQSVLVWEVVGGGKDGGIMVREGCSLKSPELRQRLQTGSLVRELAERGERICYQLLRGNGPAAGWVSIKVKKTEMLASVSKKPVLEHEVQLLIRRLAMLPVPLQKVLSFPELLCKQITEQIYEPRVGCLDRLARETDGQWLKRALLKKPLDPSSFSGFSPRDVLLQTLLADDSLTPLRKCFPRLASDGSTEYLPSMDPVAGLMPDTVSVLYFLEEKETKDKQLKSLRGIVRFGAQATQSMSRGEAEEDGEFAPGVHGGAEAMVLADAAVYLARISWNANAMLKKISCQFSKPCPCFQSLEISVTMGFEEDLRYGAGLLTAKVNLKQDKNLISFAEVQLVSFPNKPMRCPANLPPKCTLAPPGVDWVPPELAQSRLPLPAKLQPYNQQEYMTAAFKLPCMRFPKSCAAVEELGREEQERQRGRLKHVRANRPVRGGEMRNDLCFPGGLTPAAISFEKYFEKAVNGILFDGILKLGPQATDALFLKDGQNVLDGSISMVAHCGMALAALDDHLAHLPRCDGREKTSITWKLELELNALLPIGQELDFECFCPFKQTGPVGNQVTGEIRYENQILALLSAIITSGDKSEVLDNQTAKANN